MYPIRRILVSIKDPAHGVTPAASKAAQLARSTGATLELFHAITTPIYLDNYAHSDWSVADVKRDAVKRRTQQLEHIAQQLSGKSRQRKVAITINASWDYPGYAAIVRRAAALRADLVIADRHFGRHFARPIMQFADWELLRLCAVPVLLVGAQDAFSRPVVLAAVDPAHQWAKPARLDAKILSVGKSLSSALRGQLHAVHTFESAPTGIFPVAALTAKTYQEFANRMSAAAIARFRKVLDGSGIGPKRRHLLDAPVVSGLKRVLRDINADILVLGAVSRSSLRQLMIGSTAELLLDRVHCDLLIVKPEGFKPRLAQAIAGARVIPVLPPMTM